MAFGGAVKLQGETEYRKALNQITNNLTVLSSEMKKVTSSFDKDNASITDLNNVNNTLNKKLEEQKKKVNEAAAMLEKAKKETDENSITTQKWQTALNNAQSEVNKTTQQIKNNKDVMEKMKQANVSNTQELKNFEQASKDASKQTSIFGDVLKANLASDVIMDGLSKMIDGIKKVGSALLNIGKQSLSSFGEYEQLVGGVETLFKDSSGVVQEYANNAYKTAGLSANEYMNTVTSFSASLLQSLNGDTTKSAKVADMAITDMADNANKMGTDMSMIQNAYQGFAKQNYTMLDNLKLGYGGTKTEMERLLSDAEKLSGQKYDISNLNDVYQAIHVVQGELGITGTTAKEASSTIQGSLSSMKSAFQNLLTGLGNGNSNIGDLVNQLVDSVITAGNNVIPAINRISQSIIDALPQILNAITQNLPKFLKQGAKILNSLIQGIQNNMPAIMTALCKLLIC